jgi:hypothetical protein
MDSSMISSITYSFLALNLLFHHSNTRLLYWAYHKPTSIPIELNHGMTFGEESAKGWQCKVLEISG